ncbi:Nn.00g099440.m01.CDS01 [Neocucurbitaria sp. VM-36]
MEGNLSRRSRFDETLDHTDQTATIPLDLLHHYLANEVVEWFYDKGIDPDEVLAKYNDDGTLKEIDKATEDTEAIEAIKPTWWNALRNVLRDVVTKFEYDGVRLDRLSMFLLRGQREQYRTNPYGLGSAFYLVVFCCLVMWPIGSLVLGHKEAQARLRDGDKNGMNSLYKGAIGGIPGVAALTMFLFPPLIAAT